MIEYYTDAHGLAYLDIANRFCTARLYLQGAHLVDFTSAGQNPLLWLSPCALFALGKAIRGGVPLCWPWFGAHPDDSTLPQHGVVRTALWEVSQHTTHPDGSESITLTLAQPHPLLPSFISVYYTIHCGATLGLELTTTNQGNTPWHYSEALHTYLAVGAIESVTLEGLEGVTYIDKCGNFARKKELHAALAIIEETDRIYLDAPATLRLIDTAWHRGIEIQSGGAAATVIWNPWLAKAKAMSDFEDMGYRQMLCVEAANTAECAITLAPGQSHTLTQRLAILTQS